MGSTCTKGKGRVWVFFVPIGLNGIFLNRNVFDLCVKSREYFHTESTVHWLSEDIVKFEVDGGFIRKVQM